jgi:glycerophosphoryl diester phosphodiesterase
MELPKHFRGSRRHFIRQASVLATGLLAGNGFAKHELHSSSGIFRVPNTRKKPRFIAHRGSQSLAPENSLPAFEEAGRRGFWGIETDIRITKDRVLVCFHDATLKKMLGVNGLVKDHTFEELSKLPFTSGNGRTNYPPEKLRIPLFTEYLDVCQAHGSVPFIEIKDDVTDKVLAVLRDRKLEESSVISSSDFKHIETARAISGKVFVHHIFSDEERAKCLAVLGFAGLSYKREELDDTSAALVEKAHKAGLRICLRAGDTKERVLKMLEMGMDYIPTNEILDM